MHDLKQKWRDEARHALPAVPLVSEIFKEYLADKTRQGLSAYHLRDIQIRLGKFADAFKLRINRITRAELETWLNGLGVGAVTWNNYRTSLAGFFGFAKLRKFLPADWTEMDSIKPIDLADTEPVVFSPKAFSRIIEAATPESFQILLAIGAFAGIRSEECCKLKWEDFDWDSGFIFLRKNIVKGKASQRHQRQVPIADNLAEWLAPHRHNRGLICPYKTPKVASGYKDRLARKLGIKWVKNGLRKSWISYQLALTQDAGKVARWAGNSPSVIASNYEKLVTPEAAREWFSIRPQTVMQGILKLDFDPKKA